MAGEEGHAFGVAELDEDLDTPLLEVVDTFSELDLSCAADAIECGGEAFTDAADQSVEGRLPLTLHGREALSVPHECR